MDERTQYAIAQSGTIGKCVAAYLTQGTALLDMLNAEYARVSEHMDDLCSVPRSAWTPEVCAEAAGYREQMTALQGLKWAIQTNGQGL